MGERIAIPTGDQDTQNLNDVAQKQWAAFEDWAQSINLRILECRIHGHRFADWSDHVRTRTTRHPDGNYTMVAPCMRKCGVILTRFIDPDGYLLRSNRITHDYSETGSPETGRAYRMPKAARSGRGYTKAQRAYLRREMLERQAEWITEE